MTLWDFLPDHETPSIHVGSQVLEDSMGSWTISLRSYQVQKMTGLFPYGAWHYRVSVAEEKELEEFIQ